MRKFIASLPALMLLLFLFAGEPAKATSLPETYYFWMGPHESVNNPLFPGRDDSFVIAVPQAQGLQILALLAAGKKVGVGTEIASGSVPYNKDYYSPDRRVWNWHVTSVTWIFDFAETIFHTSLDPRLDSSPSDIGANPDAWIAAYGNRYTPKYYHVITAVDSSRLGLVVNVSNRGQTGTGENTLITGFMVQGAEPRNVVIRAIGPSLRASGIEHPASNPAIDLYQGSRKIASNLDWRNGSRSGLLTRLQLAPADDSEAALYLTLLPGKYTVHTVNEDRSQGVVVTEVYDVDGGAPDYRAQ